MNCNTVQLGQFLEDTSGRSQFREIFKDTKYRVTIQVSFGVLLGNLYFLWLVILRRVILGKTPKIKGLSDLHFGLCRLMEVL